MPSSSPTPTTPTPLTPGAVLERVIALHGADAGDVQRLDPRTGRLELIEWRGLTPDAAERWRWIDPRTDTTVCARAFRGGEPLAISDVFADPPFQPYADTAASQGIRAVCSFPITAEGVCVGVLSVMHAAPRPTTALTTPLAPDLLARTLHLLKTAGHRWLHS